MTTKYNERNKRNWSSQLDRLYNDVIPYYTNNTPIGLSAETEQIHL